jgi:predicted nucleic acid-binding Zn ribbon protein
MPGKAHRNPRPEGEREKGEKARPEPVGSVIREALGQAAMSEGVALGRLVRRWEEVVGGDLARETMPVALRQGTLVVAASTGAWAAQVRFLASELGRQADRMLGGSRVRSVRVTVRREASRSVVPQRFRDV